MNRLRVVLVVVFWLAGHVQVEAQTAQPQECPIMSDHREKVNQRGDQVMGFSHEKTTHHFRLYPDGGEIDVESNDPRDMASRDQIRAHLAHIAQMFAAGNFDAPMLIHDRVPPGVTTLKQLKSAVSYQFQDTDRGGRVRITTQNTEALKNVHAFLRFQIAEHQTDDSVRVSTPGP